MSIYKWRLPATFVYQTPITPLSAPFGNKSRLRFGGTDKNPPWLEIRKDGQIVVRHGYAWDGCSPKFNLWDICLVGTPDGVPDATTGFPKTYYASLIHDALYQFMDKPNFPYTRGEADLIFLELLRQADFRPALVYYAAVRAFGRWRERLSAAWTT